MTPFVLAAGLAVPLTLPARADPAPIDVVVVLLDDARAGDIERAMPETRALLAGGTWLPSFTLPTGLCCPERASLLTGRYAHNHGVRGIGGKRGGWWAFRAHQGETVAVALQRAGYRTALYGKYLNFWPRHRSAPPGWDAGSFFGSRMPYRTRTGYLTDTLRDRAVRFVTEGAGPVLLWFAPRAPHNPAEPASRHRDLFPEASGLDRRRLQTLAAVDEAVVAIAAALGPDRWAGACVFVLSDNGAILPGGGKVQKGTWRDAAVRVPALIRCPGLPGGTDDRLAASIDIAPTILDAAGVDAWWEVDGRSLLSDWERTGVLVEGWKEPGTKRNRTYSGVKTRDGLYLETRKPRRSVRYYAAGDEGVNRIVEVDAAAWADWLESYRRCAGDSCRAEDRRAVP